MGLWDSIKKKASDVVDKYTSRQPSGKQPDTVASTNTTSSQPTPYTGGLVTHGHANTSSPHATTSGSPNITSQPSGGSSSNYTPRQQSGKQPDPVVPAGTLGGLPVITDVRKNLDTYLKSPEGVAAADDAKQLIEDFDLKQMNKQFEAAATHGKEIVFEFSKPLTSNINTYVSKLVKLLGGKRSYIENETKLVVVM